MRTRRIVIRCRRTGRSAVTIGTTGTGLPSDPPVPQLPPGFGTLPSLDLPSLYGTPVYEALVAEPPAGVGFETPPERARTAADHSEATALSGPDHLADAGPTGLVGRAGLVGACGQTPVHGDRSTVNPWRSNRGPDLTLADILARPDRRDLEWNRNPGWPAGIGWAHIASAARGRSPRHARTGRRIRPVAVLCTGIAMVATAMVMLVASVLR